MIIRSSDGFSVNGVMQRRCLPRARASVVAPEAEDQRLSFPMPRVPKGLMKIYKEHGNVRKYSRMYNNIFSFSALGTTGGFHRLNGLANLVLHGRTYHFLPQGMH